jgi:hypothetical protein
MDDGKRNRCRCASMGLPRYCDDAAKFSGEPASPLVSGFRFELFRTPAYFWVNRSSLAAVLNPLPAIGIQRLRIAVFIQSLEQLYQSHFYC